MHAQSYANKPGYLLLVTGLILSLMSAFVPHFEAGYKLLTSVFIVGLFPYFVYAMAVPLSRNLLTTIIGLAIVIAHALLVFNERFSGKADYSDGIIYYAPIIMAVTVLPLVLLAIKKSLKS